MKYGIMDWRWSFPDLRYLTFFHWLYCFILFDRLLHISLVLYIQYQDVYGAFQILILILILILI